MHIKMSELKKIIKEELETVEDKAFLKDVKTVLRDLIPGTKVQWSGHNWRSHTAFYLDTGKARLVMLVKTTKNNGMAFRVQELFFTSDIQLVNRSKSWHAAPDDAMLAMNLRSH